MPSIVCLCTCPWPVASSYQPRRSAGLVACFAVRLGVGSLSFTVAILCELTARQAALRDSSGGAHAKLWKQATGSHMALCWHS